MTCRAARRNRNGMQQPPRPAAPGTPGSLRAARLASYLGRVSRRERFVIFAPTMRVQGIRARECVRPDAAALWHGPEFSAPVATQINESLDHGDDGDRLSAALDAREVCDRSTWGRVHGLTLWRPMRGEDVKAIQADNGSAGPTERCRFGLVQVVRLALGAHEKTSHALNPLLVCLRLQHRRSSLNSRELAHRHQEDPVVASPAARRSGHPLAFGRPRSLRAGIEGRRITRPSRAPRALTAPRAQGREWWLEPPRLGRPAFRHAAPRGHRLATGDRT